MTTWWLAIDRRYTSYNELKYRKVIAQGWPDLGNLTTLCALAKANEEETFKSVVKALDSIGYGTISAADKVMWNLFNLRIGDILVGVEGTRVKGVCQLTKNAWESYQYHSPEAYDYAQTIGFPVEWIDWDPAVFGPPPGASGHGPQGVERLQNESQRVADAWAAYQAKRQS